MIATDTLMIIAGLVFIKRIRGEVQYSIVECLVAQNQFIRLCLLLRSLTLTFWNKHLVVQITLVHRPQVNEAEHHNDSHGILFLQLAKCYSQ